jgi:hypothetical protein
VALSPQDNESFFREVDERLREQQVIDLWRNHGRSIVFVVVALLAVVAGWMLWRNHQQTQAEGNAVKLSGVLDDLDAGKTVKPARLDEIQAMQQTGYRLAARLLAADLALKRGDSKAAIAGYGAIATDTSLPQPYRELALVRQTAAEFDQVPPATIIARMKPLAVAGGPWLGSAGEMLGAAYVRDGKPAQAAPVFGMIAKDAKVPPSLRSRAEQVAATLGYDTGSSPAAKE